MNEFILSSEDLKDGKICIVKLLYLSSLVESKVEARRLVSQGVVVIDGERILDVKKEIFVTDDTILKAGEFSICKIKIEGRDAKTF